MQKTALFSLYDQCGAVQFARNLTSLGWQIVAASETCRLLIEHNVPVRDFSDYFSIEGTYPFPATLHPRLELALTTVHAPAIDLVYVTTYPLTEGLDVGGHAILALAAKGRRIPVSNPEDMAVVIQTLASHHNDIPFGLRDELIGKVFAKIASHYLTAGSCSSEVSEREIIIGTKALGLLEGENPYQKPCDLFKREPGSCQGLLALSQLIGEVPSYTNLADLDCLLQVLWLAEEGFKRRYQKVPFISIAAKHGNPCGLAIDWQNTALALEKSLMGYPEAVFGGELVCNFPITASLADSLMQSQRRKELLGSSRWSLDLVAASSIESAALDILSRRKRLKAFSGLPPLDAGEGRWAYRMVRGGFIRQPCHNFILTFDGFDTSTESNPELPGRGQFPGEDGELRGVDCPELFSDTSSLDSLLIAWAVAWGSFSGGNEVALARDRMLIGAAGGPMTREACKIAIERARGCRHEVKGSVFAANAFFPFLDAPVELAAAGCCAGVVPSGGRNAQAVEDFFKEKKITVLFLPEQCRGFYGH